MHGKDRPLRAEVKITPKNPPSGPSAVVIPIITVLGVAGTFVALLITYPTTREPLKAGDLGIIAHHSEKAVRARLADDAGTCLPEGDVFEPIYVDCRLLCGTLTEVIRVEPGRTIMRVTGRRTACRGRPVRHGAEDTAAAIERECPAGSLVPLAPATARLAAFRYEHNAAEIEAEFLAF